MSSRSVWSTRASSRTARAITQRNPVSKKQKIKIKNTISEIKDKHKMEEAEEEEACKEFNE